MSLAAQWTAPPSSHVPLRRWVQRPGGPGSKFTSWWTASISTSARWGVKPSAMSPTRSSTRWTGTTQANRTTTNLAASSPSRWVPWMRPDLLRTVFKKHRENLTTAGTQHMHNKCCTQVTLYIMLHPSPPGREPGSGHLQAWGGGSDRGRGVFGEDPDPQPLVLWTAGPAALSHSQQQAGRRGQSAWVHSE